jgi:hypothetical protein
MKEQPEARLRYAPEGDDDLVLFVEIKRGKCWYPIAKRYSNQHWISLEPGYTVRGTEPGADYNILEIEYCPTLAGPQ